jgi:hypothetical protein
MVGMIRFPAKITYTRPHMLNLWSYCCILWILVAIPVLTTPIYFSAVRTLNNIPENMFTSILTKNRVCNNILPSKQTSVLNSAMVE